MREGGVDMKKAQLFAILLIAVMVASLVGKLKYGLPALGFSSGN
jgi:hypothetical protein